MLSPVILSAAKNLQVAFQTRRWPEILRCAQNDTASSVSHSKTLFTYLYPIVPAPVIFLVLGTILLGSKLLPHFFGYSALVLGILFAVVGLIGLFTTSILTIVVLSLQALWVLAAGIVFGGDGG